MRAFDGFVERIDVPPDKSIRQLAVHIEQASFHSGRQQAVEKPFFSAHKTIAFPPTPIHFDHGLKKSARACTLNEMSPVTEKVLEQMTKTIVETVKPRKIILFGSHAHGDARPQSDVDILVIEDEPFGVNRSRRKEMARLWQALSRFEIAKDILVYASEEADKWKESRNHVVAHALKFGRVLYESG